MPTISKFYGIVITMNFVMKEHNPPHIHAKYGEFNASFIISDGETLDGTFPPKATLLVKEFIFNHQEELLEMWNTQTFKALPPLE